MGAIRVQRVDKGPWPARQAHALWHTFDIQMALYALALGIVGLLIAWTNSAGAPLAAGSTFTRGLMWFAIAIVVFTVAAAFEYRWLRTFAWLIYVVNIALLLLTLALGTGVGGVSRWVSIMGLQFQFSEVAKILMVAVLAAYLYSRRENIGSLWTIVGAALLVMPPLALVLVQPDLGTSLVFGAVLGGMLFMTGARLRWLLLGMAGILAALPLIWLEVLKDYQRRRLLSFLDPAADPQGSGYQVVQSQIAVGSGGLFGKGLTNGGQSAQGFLPERDTDFAAAVLLEELGFVGGLVVLILFVALLWRVLLIGWQSDHLFGIAFAAGIASLILFQLVVNVGMVLGIMPVTGIPLPFITHGGASLISIALGLGLLQSITMRRAQPSW
ncbi:rod shape-determining protein RodA [soil metagenome]